MIIPPVFVCHVTFSTKVHVHLHHVIHRVGLFHIRQLSFLALIKLQQIQLKHFLAAKSLSVKSSVIYLLQHSSSSDMSSASECRPKPRASQASSPVPQLFPETREQHIQTTYSQLSSQIETLQANSIRNSNPQNRFYSLLVPCLPSLLTSNRKEGLSYLRHTFITLANTHMDQRNTLEKSYTNVGSAVLWALDNAENADSYTGESSALLLVQALGTVVHVITRLCNREWGLENVSDNAYQIDDTSTTQVRFTSRTYQGYHSQTLVNPQLNREHLVKLEQHECMQSREDRPQIYTRLFGSLPEYIHRGGKSITKRERVQHVRNGCLFPSSHALKEYESESGQAMHHTKTVYLEMMYKNGNLFECIPIRYARFPYENMCRYTAAEKECLKKMGFWHIEVDDSQYHRVIALSKKAYREAFPDATPMFRVGVSERLFGVRREIRIWVLPSCFVRVEDGEEFAEWPILKALEMCQHDLYGMALLEFQFVDQVDSTLILISLLGMVVERDLLNHDDAVFEILDSHRTTNNVISLK